MSYSIENLRLILKIASLAERENIPRFERMEGDIR